MNSQLKLLWTGIKDRCLNPKTKSYKDYGARGISMHELWIEDFQAFSEYITKNLGPCPEWASLDRIDNNGHYEPGNLRWASRWLQNINSNRHNSHRNIYLKLSGRWNVRIARCGYGSYETLEEAQSVRDYWLTTLADLDAMYIVASQNSL